MTGISVTKNLRQGTARGVPNTMAGAPLSRQRVLLRDFSDALRQQMFFWGRDVLTGGNLLLRHGFEKRESPGLKGTSCYFQRHEDGLIELHGACAGWYPDAGSARPGLLYVRARGRCTTHHLHEPVVPGVYDPAAQESRTAEVMEAARIFAAWLVEYEAWVVKMEGAAYREGCWRMLARLPKGRPWLPAHEAARWLREFSLRGAGTPRSRQMFAPHGEAERLIAPQWS